MCTWGPFQLALNLGFPTPTTLETNKLLTLLMPPFSRWLNGEDASHEKVASDEKDASDAT